MNKCSFHSAYTVPAVFILVLIFFFTGIDSAFAQEISDHLEAFNTKRISINKTGMVVLSGWAAANIAGSSYGYFKTGGRHKYFHQMNVAWNVVNLGIGLYAWQSLAGQNPAAFSLAESLSEGQSIENILLLNIGLDLGYVALGGYLRERGLRKNSTRLQGYGPSLMLQGGFLLALDIALYVFNGRNNQQIMELLEHVRFTGHQLSLHIPL